jgi:hypothetical protein
MWAEVNGLYVINKFAAILHGMAASVKEGITERGAQDALR